MEVDGVAVVVGTETILKSDVVREMQRANVANPAPDEFVRRMIDRHLILRAAQEAKVTMQDWIVDNRIREIIDQGFGGDRNKLMAMLSERKISYPEWRARMKEDLIVSAMRWNVVDKNVTARPMDMQKEYTAHPERYRVGTKVSVSVILLKPEDSAKRDEVSLALKTKSFAEVAKRYSADSRAAEGGQWKMIDPKDVFKPEICDAIAELPKSALSRWIELDGWSFLLRKDAEFPGEQKTFEEAYDEVEAAVKENEAKRLYDEWIQRLREETYIKVY